MSSIPDFVLEKHGSVLFLLRPVSDAGRSWIGKHIGQEYGFQPYYPILVIAPQYVAHLLQRIRESGLEVR